MNIRLALEMYTVLVIGVEICRSLVLQCPQVVLHLIAIGIILCWSMPTIHRTKSNIQEIFYGISNEVLVSHLL